MNERIKELAEQALRESVNLQLSYNSGTLSVSKGFTDKFAELIVKECAIAVDKVYENAEPDHGCYDWATFANGSDVLKHFGIE
jgi:hypothetical protein